MKIIFLVIFSVIVISQSIDLDNYNNFFFECYVDFKKAHYKFKAWSHHIHRHTHHDVIFRKHIHRTVDTDHRFWVSHQSFYHPVEGIHSHNPNSLEKHRERAYIIGHDKNYDNHPGEPDGFFNFGMLLKDSGYHHQKYTRKYEDCFLKCIIEKIGVYENGEWKYDKIVTAVGGIDAVTKAAAFKCVEKNKIGTPCQQIYGAVKCYFNSLSIGTCKPKR